MEKPRNRHAPMDALRGLVIVLMALDHVRGFFTPVGANPTALESTTIAFFFSRWSTHLCAPVFVLLMGVGASLRHGRAPVDTRWFLVKRGLWLIALELTWVSFSWSWDPSFHYLGVLWSLGSSMLLLALLCGLPRRALLGIGLLGTAFLALNWLERGMPGTAGWFYPTSFTVMGATVSASYVVIPWFFVAAVGWGAARWLITARPLHMALLGGGVCMGGTVLRLCNWGDPRQWQSHSEGLVTFFDVLHVSKYPPSLVFLMWMLGIGLLLMAGPLRREGTIQRWLVDLGRVPMFFYLVHLPLAHLGGNLLAWWWFGTAKIPAAQPLRLWVVWLAWVVLVAALTPACRAWGRLKRTKRSWWWLAYL